LRCTQDEFMQMQKKLSELAPPQRLLMLCELYRTRPAAAVRLWNEMLRQRDGMAPEDFLLLREREFTAFYHVAEQVFSAAVEKAARERAEKRKKNL